MKTLTDTGALARANARAAAAAEKGKEAPVKMFLPGMDDWLRAMPNPLARSSLFAPIARGRRKAHVGTILVSRSDAVIEYWGEQLDEADADIMMQLVHEATDAELGVDVAINRAAFLMAIGRSTGKQNYDWLHRRMKALTAAALFIEAKKRNGGTKYKIGRTLTFRIVDNFGYNDESESYTFRLDPRWRQMFGNREFALIDWDKRLQIGRGQDMAKALQRLVATSSDLVQYFGLDWLKDKMQYGGPMRKFKESLTAAMRELERLEIVGGARIEKSTRGKEQARWTKLETKKHRYSVPALSV